MAQINAREEQKEFRSVGKTYLDKVLPLEQRLKRSKGNHRAEEIVRESITTISQELANSPQFIRIIQTFWEQRNEETLEAIYDFFEQFPVAKYLKEKAKNAYPAVRQEVVHRIVRLAYALKRIDEINGPNSYTFKTPSKGGSIEEKTAQGNAGQIAFKVESFVRASAKETLQQVPDYQDSQSLGQPEVDDHQTELMLICELSPDTIPYSLLNWVTATAEMVRTQNLKIFDTPETQSILHKLERVSRQKNGLGGTILYGPPGTGKTEILIERNKRQGFKSRVISIHHFTDVTQLLGEKPIPIGIDKNTSYIQRLQAVTQTLEHMLPAQKYEFIKSKHHEGTVAWQAFLQVCNIYENDILHKSDITEEDASVIIEKLISAINNKIILIGTGLNDGFDEEAAWVRGEIIQAFENGELPILDEMDKASEYSLQSISRLLNLTPGSKIMLGNREFTIPSWAKIDGTANAMNLAAFLHDRFAPNIFHIDFSSAKDTLLKSLVWLADRQGIIHLPQETQCLVLGLMVYVFPQIQKLYPNYIEHPLSNRGIRKFCQMVSSGQNVYEALQTLLLKKAR